MLFILSIQLPESPKEPAGNSEEMKTEDACEHSEENKDISDDEGQRESPKKKSAPEKEPSKNMHSFFSKCLMI